MVMDEEHRANAVRYITLNPVHARLVERMHERPWSSDNAHLSGRYAELVTVAHVLERYGDFTVFLDQEENATAFRMLCQSETTGRPLGSDPWIENSRDWPAGNYNLESVDPKGELWVIFNDI